VPVIKSMQRAKICHSYDDIHKSINSSHIVDATDLVGYSNPSQIYIIENRLPVQARLLIDNTAAYFMINEVSYRCVAVSQGIAGSIPYIERVRAFINDDTALPEKYGLVIEKADLEKVKAELNNSNVMYQIKEERYEKEFAEKKYTPKYITHINNIADYFGTPRKKARCIIDSPVYLHLTTLPNCIYIYINTKDFELFTYRDIYGARYPDILSGLVYVMMSSAFY